MLGLFLSLSLFSAIMITYLGTLTAARWCNVICNWDKHTATAPT